MEQKKLLITGCGRSGTLYTAQVWRSLGLDIRHERPLPPHGSMGKDGAASWFLAVDDTNPPFGPGARGYQFEFVLHVVRHPLRVIASVAQFILQHGVLSPEYIERHAPETRLSFEEYRSFEPKQQLILRAARYWYHWNQLAERKADQTVQVEQLNSALPALCRRLEIEYKPGQAGQVPKNTNARWRYVKDEPWVIEWADIEALDASLCMDIRHLADQYGYVDSS